MEFLEFYNGKFSHILKDNYHVFCGVLFGGIYNEPFAKYRDGCELPRRVTHPTKKICPRCVKLNPQKLSAIQAQANEV